MSLAIVYTRAALGIEAPLITVEVHLSNGLPGLTMVGLPETTVKEARDRVRSALINSGYAFPAKKITINLAPADLPKEGGRCYRPAAGQTSAGDCGRRWSQSAPDRPARDRENHASQPTPRSPAAIKQSGSSGERGHTESGQPPHRKDAVASEAVPRPPP